MDQRATLILHLKAGNIFKKTKSELLATLVKLGQSINVHPWVPGIAMSVGAEQVDLPDCRAWLFLTLAGADNEAVRRYGPMMRQIVTLNAVAMFHYVSDLTSNPAPCEKMGLCMSAARYLVRELGELDEERATRLERQNASLRAQISVARGKEETLLWKFVTWLLRPLLRRHQNL